MALDGAFLRCIKEELEGFLSDARVDKIHQPSKEELILTLRQRSGAYKLYISTRAASPRLHFTGISSRIPRPPHVLHAAAQNGSPAGGWRVSGRKGSNGPCISTSTASTSWGTWCA